MEELNQANRVEGLAKRRFIYESAPRSKLRRMAIPRDILFRLSEERV